MQPGVASQTATLVCLARAVAHGRIVPTRFADPVAATLLPPEAKERLDDIHKYVARKSGRVPQHLRGIERLAHMMVTRTMTIDAFIKNHPLPQLVILGAGLDGRAWRMPELRETVVFEVDHPDTQAYKRSRIGALPLMAKELNFVAVDFTKDDLTTCLRAAGHDPHVPTLWIWEGVVMYLTPAQVDATLADIASCSATASRLCIHYHKPSLLLLLVAFKLWMIGEPLRSTFAVERMQAVLARHGFQKDSDEDLPTLSKAIDSRVAAMTASMQHTRIATGFRI